MNATPRPKKDRLLDRGDECLLEVGFMIFLLKTENLEHLRIFHQLHGKITFRLGQRQLKVCCALPSRS
jgi:hypothetical protein